MGKSWGYMCPFSFSPIIVDSHSLLYIYKVIFHFCYNFTHLFVNLPTAVPVMHCTSFHIFTPNVANCYQFCCTYVLVNFTIIKLLQWICWLQQLEELSKQGQECKGRVNGTCYKFGIAPNQWLFCPARPTPSPSKEKKYIFTRQERM